MFVTADRGVSDLVAFVLTFSIIIAGVGIVSVGAYGSLGEFSDREQVDSAERGLVAGATALDDIHRETDTRRSFTLGLSGGFVYLNESTINVTVSRPDDNETLSAHNALEHRFNPQGSGPVSIAYEAGGIFGSNAVGARYGPSVRCTNETAVVSLVNLTTADSIAVSEGFSQQTVLNPNALSLPQGAPVGISDQTLSFDARLESVETAVVREGTVTIDVGDSANPTRWEEHLNQPATEWSGEGPSFECDRDTIVVRVTTIELSV